MAVERLGLSLHGAREEDLMEGVIPAHPLDMQDALIEYSRKGAIINMTGPTTDVNIGALTVI